MLAQLSSRLQKSARSQLESNSSSHNLEFSSDSEDVIHLNPKLMATFGNTSAPVSVVHYFSLSCPGCIRFIEQEFPQIEEEYIDLGQICWQFKPLPTDFLTIRTKALFERLTEEQKTKFIRFVPAYFKEATPHASDLSLERFQAECQLPSGLWIDKQGTSLQGTETLQEVIDFWGSGAFPLLHHFSIAHGQKRVPYMVEPTKELIDDAMAHFLQHSGIK